MLGSTLERVRLPDDLVARLEGKSSLGRLGLLIHSTAGFVDAGWDGHLTLELSNVANLPITLYPGMKIGQISFFQMTTPADRPYGSRDSTPSTRDSAVRRRAATARTSARTPVSGSGFGGLSPGYLLDDFIPPDPGLGDVHVPVHASGSPPLVALPSPGRRSGTGPLAGVPPVPRQSVELVEVAAREALQADGPRHRAFFTMWGFTVLLLTILEAYGELFRQELPRPGSSARDRGLGFLEDFFAVAVLVSLGVFG